MCVTILDLYRLVFQYIKEKDKWIYGNLILFRITNYLIWQIDTGIRYYTEVL